MEQGTCGVKGNLGPREHDGGAKGKRGVQNVLQHASGGVKGKRGVQNVLEHASGGVKGKHGVENMLVVDLRGNVELNILVVELRGNPLPFMETIH